MIRGLQVNLRAAERSDARFLRDLLNEPATGEGWGTAGVPVSLHRIESDLETWLESERTSGRPPALVIETLDGDAVGVLQIDVSRRFNQSQARLSVAITAQRQGEGLGRDALLAVIDALFNEWDIHRIEVRCEAGNDVANRLYRGLGFHMDATRHKGTFTGGEFRDQHVYSLLSTDSRRPAE